MYDEPLDIMCAHNQNHVHVHLCRACTTEGVCNSPDEGTLTKGEGSIQLISSFNGLFFKKIAVLNGVDLT